VVVKSGEIYDKRAKSGENTEGVSNIIIFFWSKKTKKEAITSFSEIMTSFFVHFL
jgi:hypothetical protein